MTDLTIQTVLDQLNSDTVKAMLASKESMRLLHGRGHSFDTDDVKLNFLNIDWFAPVVWIVTYGEQDEALTQQLQEAIKAWAQEQEHVETVYWQSRGRGKAAQFLLYGQEKTRGIAYEQGAEIALNFTDNQNIGFFLDAKPARLWVKEQAQGKRVLNMFSYTCSFSVAALLGGAEHVVNIDMAKGALAQGQKNHQLNKLPIETSSFLPHDVFRSMRNLERKGPFDLIIIDPPSRQRRSFEADKDYLRLLKKLEPLLTDKTQIIALLNAPYLDDAFLPKIFAEALPQFTYVERLAQRDDFPETDLAACLKMQVFTC